MTRLNALGSSEAGRDVGNTFVEAVAAGGDDRDAGLVK